MQKIQTIKKIPVEIEKFFKKFIKVFTKQTLWVEGTKIEVAEIGPNEGNKTTFQCLPTTMTNSKFIVVFEKNKSGIDVLYESQVEMNMPDLSEAMGGFGGKMMGGMMKKVMKQASGFMQQATGMLSQVTDNQMKTLIQTSIQKTISKLKDKKQEHENKETPKKTKDPIKLLKLKFVEGEISEEEYLRKKKILEE